LAPGLELFILVNYVGNAAALESTKPLQSVRV